MRSHNFFCRLDEHSLSVSQSSRTGCLKCRAFVPKQSEGGLVRRSAAVRDGDGDGGAVLGVAALSFLLLLLFMPGSVRRSELLCPDEKQRALGSK